MTKVALQADPVNDLLAAPLRDQTLDGSRTTVLVLLVAVAILLFQALRAVLAAVVALLMPALVLLRSFLLVGALAAVIGYGLVTDAETPAEEPGGTAPSPTSVHRTPAPTPPPEARPDRTTPHR